MAGSRFKVHDVLQPRELAEFTEYARDKRHTIDDCQAWMKSHGSQISRSAIGRFVQDLHENDRQMAVDVAAAVQEKNGAIHPLASLPIPGIAPAATAATIMVKVGAAEIFISPGASRKDILTVIQMAIEASKNMA
jgi:hypothetical protein